MLPQCQLPEFAGYLVATLAHLKCDQLPHERLRVDQGGFRRFLFLSIVGQLKPAATHCFILTVQTRWRGETTALTVR